LNVDFSKFVAPDYSLALSQEETQILQVVDVTNTDFSNTKNPTAYFEYFAFQLII